MHSIPSFCLVHEIKGNIGRLRVRTQAPLSKKTVKRILHALEDIQDLEDINVNARTGSILLFYTSITARNHFFSLLRIVDTELSTTPAVRIISYAVSLPKKTHKFPLLWPIVKYGVMRLFMPPWLRVLFSIKSAWPFLKQGLISLFRGDINVELLDATAITISFLRRDLRTVSLLTFLLGLGEALEEWTKHSSRASLAQSLALDVDTVWVRREHGDERIAFSELSLDDAVIIRTGSVIVVDGVVIDGEALVNQASMTGEAQAVVRRAGASVFAGTVVEEGSIVVRPTSMGKETRLQNIVNFIEESQALKANIEGRSMRLANAAVPFTFGLAALVWLVTRDPIRASSVLLVDFSCALRLATPLAILAAMREGASRGVLIKGGVFLEAMATADTVIFDKTGTLTEARPQVAEVIACEGNTTKEVLRLAACMEEHFPHPVARAITRKAEEENLKHAEEHGEVEYIVAHGIASQLFGDRVLLGSRHYICDDENVDISSLKEEEDRLIACGYSLLYLAKAGKIAGLIAISDSLRQEAKSVIEELRFSGIARIVMLTGDDSKAAANMAKNLGITEYYSGILPVDKARIVQELQAEGARVIMVGDGVNDAPALSIADVGVSLRDGTDLAKEVADVVLLESDLHSLLVARRLGIGTMRRIQGNFVSNIGLNAVFLFLGLFGVISPIFSAVLHNITTLGVTLNATRPHLTVR